MLVLSENIRSAYVHFLSTREIPKNLVSRFEKWLRFYLDFCHKYQHPSENVHSLELFLVKLAEKRQPEQVKNEATKAVQLYYELVTFRRTPTKHDNSQISPPQQPLQPEKNTGKSWEAEYEELVNAIRIRHYSPKTLRSYRKYIRDFQSYTKSLSPQMVSPVHVKDFLTFLTVEKNVSASTQNLAFNSLLFFFRHVLKKEFGHIDGVVRAKKKPYIPVVLSRKEIDQVFAAIDEPYLLIVKLLYGCGLRLSECLMLRVNCLNIDDEILTVHDGKGKKDRTVPIPQTLKKDLSKQLQSVRELHSKDMGKDYDGAFMFDAFEKKSKNAAREFIWQWLFPARQLTKVKATGKMKRSHLHITHVQKAIRRAAAKAYLTKRVTAHTFRHSFASHLLQNNYDIRTIQELLGHSDVRTTMIYTHTVKSVTLKEAKSPLDF